MAQFDIVFEGGGAKGSAFVGALLALGEAGHTWRRLVGTSAGAITAALVAAGYTPNELLDAVNERSPNGKPRFAAFMDKPVAADFDEATIEGSDTMKALKAVKFPGPLGMAQDWFDKHLLHALLDTGLYAHLFSFNECGGLFAGVAFVQWLQEKLQKKGIDITDTFETFARKMGKPPGSAYLTMLTTDTTDHESLVLNDITAPKCPIVWAVRMSMSIPFIWREMVWLDAWGTYMGRPKSKNILVDGGVLSNFPIAEIATSMPDIMGTVLDPMAALNLGLLLDEMLPVAGMPNTARAPIHVPEFRLVDRVRNVIDTMMESSDESEIRKYESEVCHIPVKGFGTTEFDMPPERLNALVNSGRVALKAHLASRPADKMAVAAR